MTAEQIRQLAILACRVSDDAAMRRVFPTRSAYVRWEIIDEIRRTLDESGVDWRRPHTKKRADPVPA